MMTDFASQEKLVPFGYPSIEFMENAISAGCYKELRRYEGAFTDEYVKEINSGAGGWIIDIGAELGYYALLAAHYAPHNPLVMFEPNPDHFNVLDKFFASKNATVRSEAVSSHIGEDTFYSGGNDERAIFSYTMDRDLTMLNSKGQKYTQVYSDTFKTITLDSLFANKLVKVVKLDIEGGEVLALQGMEQILSKRTATVFIEMHVTYINKMFPDGVEKIRQTFKKYGYRCFETGNEGLFEIPIEKMYSKRYVLKP